MKKFAAFFSVLMILAVLSVSSLAWATGTPPYTIAGSDTVRDALKVKTKGNFDDLYSKIDPATAIGTYSDVASRLAAMQVAIENAGTGTALVMSGENTERTALIAIPDGLIFVETDTGETYRWDQTGGAWYQIVDSTNPVNALTASRLIASGSGKVLESVADLSAWIGGTANQITVSNDGDGSVTLSLPTWTVEHNADGTHKQQALNPVGSIIIWPLETPPTGYLECDGSEKSRTTYAALFAVIGTAYGVGDGSTTFNLPNFKGQFLRGWDHAAGLDPDAGTRTDRGDGTTGDHVGTKQTDAFKSHTHYLKGNTNGNTGTGGGATYPTSGGSNLSGYVTDQEGGNETRPTNVNVVFCIKY